MTLSGSSLLFFLFFLFPHSAPTHVQTWINFWLRFAFCSFFFGPSSFPLCNTLISLFGLAKCWTTSSFPAEWVPDDTHVNSHSEVRPGECAFYRSAGNRAHCDGRDLSINVSAIPTDTDRLLHVGVLVWKELPFSKHIVCFLGFVFVSILYNW